MRVLILLPPAVTLSVRAGVTIARGVATATPPKASTPSADVGRIRAHFDSVLTELSARDVGALTSAQRAERVRLLETLRAYRNRGVFPHNYDFPGQPTPYFVDRKTGTLCAVAHLLASTGRRDIVDRVARADNNVWVAQLSSDTAVARWLSTHGLTLEEAARIQVPYMVAETPAQRARNVAFIAAAPVAVGGSLIASLWNANGNADGHRTFANVLGLGSGVMAIGMGATLIGNRDVPREIGVASAALGTVSVMLAARAFRRHNVHVAVEREAEQRRAGVETSLAPLVPSGGGGGIALSLRF
jgi:hypothetical protein